MPNSRMEIHQTLCDVLECAISGDSYECRCHFQPGPNVKMVYPAITYKLSDIGTAFADNKPYLTNEIYQLTLIDRNPESVYVDRIKELPKAKFVNFFIVDGLNHWVFTIY